MDKDKEIEVVSLMIEIFCHGRHKTKKHELCDECSELLEYVKSRRDRCPHGDNKPFCSNCNIHCYKKEMREKIREVMRYSGPRIVFSHPIIAFDHLIQSKKSKKNIKHTSGGVANDR